MMKNLSHSHPAPLFFAFIPKHQDRAGGQAHQVEGLVADHLQIPGPLVAVGPQHQQVIALHGHGLEDFVHKVALGQLFPGREAVFF